MSGFIGIVNTDGAPIDRRLVTELTESMRTRGPDAQRTWFDGQAGFGHAQFATTDEARVESMPCTLDGDAWITGDVRIDGRAALRRALDARDRSTRQSTDAELVLHAYAVWGERCVEHLIGDFSFAVWDRPRQRLFCARDHFAIKPLYYAPRGRVLVVGNTLDCIRRHPDVSGELNDLALADFLLFQRNQALDTTAFADIRRLPGAHTLTLTAGRLRIQRYWSPALLDREIRYKQPREYVEHFSELLDDAVHDRLRTRRATIMMSGGLDSTTVAATARRVLVSDGLPFQLRAACIVYDRLIPDQERQYARAAADALNIPIDFIPGDDAVPFDRWGQPELRTPEPTDELFQGLLRDELKLLSSHARVALTGWDGDTVFAEIPNVYFAELARGRHFRRLAGDLAAYSKAFRTLPHIGIRTALEHWRQGDRRTPAFPKWINEDLVRRLELRARWEEFARPAAPPPALRPRAAATMRSSLWSSFFETYDPGVTGVPLEVRHPLTDLRIIEFAMAIPAIPWCFRKTILREAMKGVLPELVRTRRKTALAGEPLIAFLRRPEEVRRIESLPVSADIGRYVDVHRLAPLTGHSTADSVYLRLRPLSLSYWLGSAAPLPTAGAGYGKERVVKVG